MWRKWGFEIKKSYCFDMSLNLMSGFVGKWSKIWVRMFLLWLMVLVDGVGFGSIELIEVGWDILKGWRYLDEFLFFKFFKFMIIKGRKKLRVIFYI